MSERQRILITGGAGFIGSHLADALVADGASVVVVDDLSTGSVESLAGIRDRVEFVRDDVTNRETMTALVADCDMIYHLAAAVGVQLIVEQPARTIETNIHGTEVVLELASKFGRRILIASTSEVYGKNAKTPFGEDDDTTLGSTRFSRWSYAASKMVDEFLALAYREQYGLEVVVCRLFNTIGPRQMGRYGMVVPRFVDRALAGEPIEVYGTGEQSRCFCHVEDVVEAMRRLMACDDALGQVVNVGSCESITMNDLARRIIERTGSTSEIRHLTYEEAYGRPFDDMLVRKPDVSRIEALVGWHARHGLDDTLDSIIADRRDAGVEEPRNNG